MEKENKAKTIMIVDDDDQLRTFLVEFLESFGYNTIQADSGQRALEILPNQHIDLIICDIRMPGVNGIRLLETVKVVSPKPFFIMITGYSPSPIQRLSVSAMADAYLKKPFTLKSLSEIVNSVLGA